MAQQNYQNRRNQQNRNNPPQKLQLILQWLKTVKVGDIFQIFLEAVVTRGVGGPTVPDIDVVLTRDAHKEVTQKTGLDGRTMFVLEAPRNEQGRALKFRAHLSGDRVESYTTVGLPAWPQETTSEFQDPERVEAEGWFIGENGLFYVDLRVVKQLGRSLKTKVHLTFPSTELHDSVETDEMGHAQWHTPWLIDPGEETMLIATVDGIDRKCRMVIKNLAPVPKLTFHDKVVGLISRFTFWIFGVPSLIAPFVWLAILLRFFGTSAKERIRAGHTTHDIWLLFLSGIFLFFVVGFILNIVWYLNKAKTKSFLARRAYKKSRHVKANSRDTVWENLGEVVKHIAQGLGLGKKSAEAQTTYYNPAVNTVGTEASTTHGGFSLGRTILTDLGMEAAFKIIKPLWRKVMGAFK